MRASFLAIFGILAALIAACAPKAPPLAPLPPISLPYRAATPDSAAAVLFDTASHHLNEDARRVVEALVRSWSGPVDQIVIVGHADAPGLSKANRLLADKRARTVRDALITLGVDRNRILIASYGETKPVVESGNDAEPLNRRVEIKVWY